jgi:predicted nucleotide-binding protein (sugar kinase/HSP70/actin superfamily)
MAPVARSVLVIGYETAFLSSIQSVAETTYAPVDVRHASPCSVGVGWMLAKWARVKPGGDASDDAGDVSGRCVANAEADLERLAARGASDRALSHQALLAAGRIVAGGVTHGGPVQTPVAVAGPALDVEHFTDYLARAFAVPADEVVRVPDAASALAVGAALLARTLGVRPDLSPSQEGASVRPSVNHIGRAWNASTITQRAHRAVESLKAVDGMTWALDVSTGEAILIEADGECSHPRRIVSGGSCKRDLARAIDDVAGMLGLDTREDLGSLAGGATRGAWLRDRCPETIRFDAETRLATGHDASEVARGVLEAVARGTMRTLTQVARPAGRSLLVGDYASVPALAEACSRSFRCEFVVNDGARHASQSTREADSTAGLGADLIEERERILQEHLAHSSCGRRIGAMGLPLSLSMAGRGPYWSAFLTEVGFDVLTLDRDPTVAEAVASSARAAGEPCTPAIELRAEAEALVAEGVDAVFLPVEVDAPPPVVPDDGKPAGVVYRCPFLQAGAHLVGVGVPVVRPTQFKAFSEELCERSLAQALSPWRIAPGAVSRGLRAAEAAQLRFERTVRAAGVRAMERLGESGRAVVLLGRSYSARRLSSDARERLRAGGVALIPQDMLPVDEAHLTRASKEMYWDSGVRLLAAAMQIVRDVRLGALYLTHPRCGPDSFIKKYARTILAEERWALLELDGSGDAARIVERAEAFRTSWDGAQKPCAGDGVHGSSRESSADPNAKPTVYFPDMGVAASAGVAALAGFDIKAEVVHADERSLRAAACHTSGDECLPYVITIGNLVKTVEDDDFDPARSAFFMASSSGSCRFGQYRRGFRQVLDALGHDDIRVIALNQSEGHTKQMPGFAFARLLWQGMMALGAIDRAALHLRPRSVDAERADAVIEECRRDVIDSLRSRVNPRAALRRSSQRFKALELDPGAIPVRIAVTGEIFVRSQPFTSSDLVRAIERAGGEAVVPPFQEWIYHVNRCVRLFQRARGKTVAVWGLRAALAFLRRGERGAERALALPSAPPAQPTLEQIWTEAHRAGFIPWFGDASLALGRSIAMRKLGGRGVVNIVPYGCLPGTTAEAVFAARRRHLAGMPVLHLHLDGGPAEDAHAKVRALVDAARSYSPRAYETAASTI